MTNTIKKPTSQWSGNSIYARSLSARAGKTISSPLKQALMPRSLDLDFSLKYRR